MKKSLSWWPLQLFFMTDELIFFVDLDVPLMPSWKLSRSSLVIGMIVVNKFICLCYSKLFPDFIISFDLEYENIHLGKWKAWIVTNSISLDLLPIKLYCLAIETDNWIENVMDLNDMTELLVRILFSREYRQSFLLSSLHQSCILYLFNFSCIAGIVLQIPGLEFAYLLQLLIGEQRFFLRLFIVSLFLVSLTILRPIPKSDLVDFIEHKTWCK